ncbi:male sterility protein-domain-containing protein [Bisporella sp. PMI_857]|nr:male sterility protein-domain-containing protein [Bisporella sp. PMI_857]
MTTIYDFYKEQAVFLTGATGGLGGCLLYKLSIVLDVQRLYVLIRGSESTALGRWKYTMPQQCQYIEDRIRAGKIILVPGDMTKERFGITIETLCKIEQEVTIIIHAAANISFRAPLQREIFQTGTTRHLKRFPWAYAYSKQIMERLIMARFPDLPILLLRPTSIGPAIAQPYEMYGPQGSCPISTLYARLMRPTRGKSIWYAPGHGANILDEIPVDLVANILLQHVHLGTHGVVHASSSYYIPKTLKWMLEQPFKHLPAQRAARMATPIFTQDQRVVQCKEAEFYQICSRAWEFNAPSSRCVRSLNGPLMFGLNDHDIDRFTERRVRSIFRDTFESTRHQAPAAARL